MAKALGISSAKARVATELLQALPTLSDTSVRGSTVDPEDLQSRTKYLAQTKEIQQNWTRLQRFDI